MDFLWLVIIFLGCDEVFFVVFSFYILFVSLCGGCDFGVVFVLSYLVNLVFKYGLNLFWFFIDDLVFVFVVVWVMVGGFGLLSGYV